MIGFSLHSVLAPLVHHGFSSLQASASKTLPDSLKHSEQAFIQEISWHKIAGSRAKKFGSFVQDGHHKQVVFTLCITLEPIRYMTQWLINASSASVDCNAPPPLLTWVSPTHSPTSVARRHISAMLAGASPRLILVWAPSGSKSLKAWIAAEPEQASLLRRLLILTDAWLYARHTTEARAMPWALACVADDRRAFEDRDATWQKFMHADECCIDPHFGRRLRKRLVSLGHTDADSQEVRALIYAWASQVKLTSAGIESRHARNRRNNTSTDGTMGMSAFNARYITREARTLQRARDGIVGNLVQKETESKCEQAHVSTYLVCTKRTCNMSSDKTMNVCVM